MATTVALATDPTDEGHVEETKLTNDINNVTKESCPEPKDLEGKDEVNFKVEDSAAEEASAPAPESKAAIVSEEKLEASKSEPQADEVKIDCPVTKNPEGKDEQTMKVEVSEVGDTSKEKQEDEKSEFVAGGVKKEEVEDETSIQEADSSTADSKEEAVSSAALEPLVEAVIPQPPQESIEASAADLEATLVQELESEKEPEILEPAAKEANTDQELPQVSSEPVTELLFAPEPVTEPSEPVTEVKETEPPIDSKDKPIVTDPSKQEASCNVSETPVKELREEGEGAVITEDVPCVPELEKVDPSVSTTTNPVPESIEGLVMLEDMVEEEMQEKAVVDVTDTAKADVGEKKEEGLDGKNTTLVDTSTDTNVRGENNANTEADNLVSENTEKDVEKTPVKPAKDIGDGPKMEVRSKSSHSQSNSMFSKVKQSIVKVKKAIIGKSSSSKTRTSETKDEVKVM